MFLEKLAGGFLGKNEPSQAVACQLIDQFLRIPHVGPAGFALIHLFSFIGGVERNSDVGYIEYNPPAVPKQLVPPLAGTCVFRFWGYFELEEREVCLSSFPLCLFPRTDIRTDRQCGRPQTGGVGSS